MGLREQCCFLERSTSAWQKLFSSHPGPPPGLLQYLSELPEAPLAHSLCHTGNPCHGAGGGGISAPSAYTLAPVRSGATLGPVHGPHGQSQSRERTGSSSWILGLCGGPCGGKVDPRVFAGRGETQKKAEGVLGLGPEPGVSQVKPSCPFFVGKGHLEGWVSGRERRQQRHGHADNPSDPGGAQLSPGPAPVPATALVCHGASHWHSYNSAGREKAPAGKNVHLIKVANTV